MSQKTFANLLVIGQFALLATLVLLQGINHDWVLPADANLVATAVLVAGAGLAFVAIFGLGKSLTASPVPLEKAELKTGALYSLMRHPIYSGLMLISFSLAATSGSWFAVLAALALCALLSFKARFEERLLLAKFEGYRAYAAKVGRFMPGIGRLRA